jgi:hypothetical protein
MSDQNDKIKLSKYAESRHRLIMDSFNTPREEREQVYLPVALAHVFFPRRDVKLDPTESYVHQSGNYELTITQLPTRNRNTNKNEYLGLPFGPKSRLLLSVINALALQQGSNRIDIDANSLSTFLLKIGLTDGGNQLMQTRNQIARLATSLISVNYQDGVNEGYQEQVPIIKGFDFFPKSDPNQLLLWNRNIVLSLDYWEELQKHPLPLSLEHLRILAGNARAIDLYTFLAYRLHHLSKPLFLTWDTMKEMFGGDIARMDHFKEKMRATAKLVKLAYSDAKFDYNQKGWNFYHSLSPIKGRDKLFLP